MKATLTRRLRVAFGLAVLALNLAVGLLILREPTLTVPISAAVMRPETGHNTIAALPIVPPFPYVFGFPGLADSEGSPATLTEDGVPLGPSHAPHTDIRAEGRGRFSLWSGEVYFSSSDNSDPRSNGRIYRVVARARLPYRVTLGLAGFDLLCLAVFWRTVRPWLARGAPVLAVVTAALLVSRIAAAAAGWMPPVFEGSATAIDGTMALAIAGHLMLGFGGFCAVYATGLGTLLWVERRPRSLADLLLPAFLPGAIVLAAAALLAVVAPGGRAMAIVVCLVAAAPLARYRPQPGEARSALLPMMISAPVVALYAIVLSFRFHGPSATIAGAPMGDETIYVGWAFDLARSIAPVPNLAVEGFTTPYGNLLPSLLAVPLLAARWFDPYLFLSASLPTLSLMAVALTAPLLARGGAAIQGRRCGTMDLLAIAGLGAAAFRYPSILVESPPFVFLLPVIVSTVYLASPGRGGRAGSWQALATATLGTAVSKVVALPVLALLPAPDVAGQLLRRAGRRQIVVAAVFGVLVLVYVAVALHAYLPVFLQVGGLGPPSWEMIVRDHVTDPLAVTCVVARDLGAVVLAAAWIGSRATGLKLGVWAGVGLGFMMPFLFHTSLTTAVLVTVFAVVAGPGPGAPARPWLVTAAAMMLPQAVLGNYGGSAVTLAWFAVVICLTAAPVRSEMPIARRAADAGPTWVSRMGPRHRGIAAATALFCGVVLWGAGVGAIDVGPKDLIFTPDMRDIWLAVRRDTPPGALLFTDQTDDTQSRLGGWDDYALAAQRQFYIVSWEFALRTDPEGRSTRLAENARVLSGALSPEALKLSRKFDGYYAVLGATATAPPWFAPIYRNPSFVLYRIMPKPSQG